MMFATPVRKSAWSSTSITVDLAAAAGRAASDSNMNLRRLRRRLPGENDFGSAARRRDNRQRGADPFGALLHARHPEAARVAIAGEPAPIVGDREPEPDRSDRRRPQRDPPC